MFQLDKEELSALIQKARDSEGDAEAQKISRREFENWLEDFTFDLKETIRGNDALPLELRDERVERSRTDVDYFRHTYFSHYYYLEGKSVLQEELEEIYHRIVSTQEIGLEFALAAPRGHGKSTDVSLVFIIWIIVFKLKYFPVILSNATELTEMLIESIKAELEENVNLKQDFPHATGMGTTWKIGDIVTKNGVRVKGYGSGKRVRGIKHGIHRPDLAVIDDLEDDEHVKSRDQRDKMEKWLDAAVSNLGSADGNLDILYIGTLLHRDSVLARKLRLKYWNPKTYRAIIQFPKRMDLWDIYTALYNNQGVKEAHDFYMSMKPEMDEGAKVLWENAVPLEVLMKKRAKNKAAFNKELQNNPSSETTKFKREYMHWWKHLPQRLEYYGWCDPAGNGKKSDYTNFTILGIDTEAGLGYVAESINEVISSNKIIDRAIELQIRYNCKVFGFETNGGQFHLKAWLLKEAGIKRIHMPLRGVHNTMPKEERIEIMELPVQNAQILLHLSQTILIEQLEDFPEALNDDAPDGLHGAYSMSRIGKTASRKKRTNYRTTPQSRNNRRGRR